MTSKSVICSRAGFFPLAMAQGAKRVATRQTLRCSWREGQFFNIFSSAIWLKRSSLSMATEFNCKELAAEWDSVETIRERLRGGGDLLTCLDLLNGRDATIAACCANQDVLLPGCHRLFAARGKLPGINKLREQVAEVYSNNQRVVDQSKIDDMAWEIRKMLRLVKRKGTRQDVSLDPRAIS